jgi:large subunit ribosomal protein L27
LAHKKGLGSSKNGRDSNSQRRGVKRFGGEAVMAGTIIMRQCGTKMLAGRNVGVGRDNTLYALITGVIEYADKGRDKKIVHVLP